MNKKLLNGFLATTALSTALGASLFLPNCLKASASNSDVVQNPIQEVPAVDVSEFSSLDNIEIAQAVNKGGRASWYGPGFHGRTTANGERFNQNAMTAAHRSLPFGTRVKVTNLNNGRSVIVRINDRGPFAKGRVIDLSKAAAGVIGMLNSGTAPVRLQVLGR